MTLNPTGEELEQKWWHRLIKVIVIISTIVIGAELLYYVLDCYIVDLDPLTSYDKSCETLAILSIFITIGWFIFWWFIVYKLIIFYIIYGGKKIRAQKRIK